MFKKILIANRGEIACRIIRTAKHMGIDCVAVYSEADKSALHVELADEAYLIGPAPVLESYLCIEKIIEVAQKSGAQAVHPGYGFLSENPDFVEACDRAKIVFIGPSANSIKAMGLKDAAKALMQQAGVPIVPGYHGDNQQTDHLQSQADLIGYPLLIKARAGGGGKGMRLVESESEFMSSLESARREAQSSFGDANVIIEKFVSSPRHIEVQVFADQHGNTLHLFERDCSMQRRHQKVIEEAPAPGMSEQMRSLMGEAAVKAAETVDYVGAGTIEFIVDSSKGLSPDAFYFMEMNTRLQVEHPITEAITGLDLVEWQLRVAAGETLPSTQQDLTINGHAIEARIYAENNFMPSIGRLSYLSIPEYGVRVDSGVRQGDQITPFYDPMIAKLIVHQASRQDALTQMQHALSETHIVGCKTNVSFLKRLCSINAFTQENLDTGLIERAAKELLKQQPLDKHAIPFAVLSALGYLSVAETNDPWQSLTGWRHFSAAKQYMQIRHREQLFDVTVITYANGQLDIVFDDVIHSVNSYMCTNDQATIELDEQIIKAKIIHQRSSIVIFKNGQKYDFDLIDFSTESGTESVSEKNILAPMPGLIIQVNVKNGQSVKQGDLLIVMEAMKMEHSLRASHDGVVDQLSVSQKDQVNEGALLLIVEPSETDE